MKPVTELQSCLWGGRRQFDKFGHPWAYDLRGHTPRATRSTLTFLGHLGHQALQLHNATHHSLVRRVIAVVGGVARRLITVTIEHLTCNLWDLCALYLHDIGINTWMGHLTYNL